MGWLVRGSWVAQGTPTTEAARLRARRFWCPVGRGRLGRGRLGKGRLGRGRLGMGGPRYGAYRSAVE